MKMRNNKAVWLIIILPLLLSCGRLSAQQWVPVPFIKQELRDQGTELGGEEGQWPQTIVFEPVNGRYVLYGTDVGGLFRSTDEGATWEPSNIGYSPRGVAFFAIDPNNTDRVIAVGGMKNGNINNGASLSKDGGITWESTHRMFNKDYKHYKDAVVYDATSYDSTLGYSTVAYWSCPPSSEPTGPVLFKSTDGGESWFVVNSGQDYGDMHVKVGPASGSLFVFGDGNLYRSRNGGESFDEILTGNVQGLETVYTHPEKLFLMKSDGIYQSTDDGNTFIQTGSAPIPDNPQRLRVSPANPDHMIHWRDVNNYNWPRYYTTDGGDSWHESEIPRGDSYFFNWRMPRQGSFSYHPTRENVIISVGNDCVTKSTDAGTTFHWSSSGVNNFCPSGIHNLNPFNHQLLLIVGRDKAGAYSSNGGYTWINSKPIEFSYSGGHGYSGYAMTEEILVACGLDRDVDGKWKICVSNDGGKSYSNTGIEASGKRTVCPDITDPAKVYLGAHMSHDYGQTWTRMSGADGVFTYNPSGSNELYGCNGESVVCSYDHGITWKLVVNVGESIDDIAVDHLAGQLYIAAGGDLFTCTLNGTGLKNITTDTPADQFGNRSIESVAVDPNHPDVAYVANASSYLMDNNIIRTTDHGENWEILTRNTRFPNPQFGKDGGRMPNYVRVCPATSEAYVGGGCFGLWKIGPPPGSAPVVNIIIADNLNSLVRNQPATVTLRVHNRMAPLDTVALLINGSVVNEFGPEPWTYDWIPGEQGEYEIRARVTDTVGTITESRILRVNVLPSELPSVSITSPGHLSEFEYGSEMGIEVEAADPDGTITLVEFFLDSVKLGEDSVAPFHFNWQAVTEGTYELTAAATDNSGQTVLSLPVTVNVNEKPYSHFYSEDFNDGLAQEWSAGAEGWTVEENRYTSPGSTETVVSTYDGGAFRDYLISVKTSPAGNDYFGIVFNYLDRDNYHYAGLVVSPAVAVLKKSTAGEEEKLGQAYYPAVEAGDWVDLELTNREGLTTLRINDSTILSNVPTPGADSGRIGMLSRNNVVRFDDIELAAREMWLTVGRPGEAEKNTGMEVYPNPVTGKFFHLVLQEPSTPRNLKLFNADGKLVYHRPFRESRITILAGVMNGPGVYILRISGSEGVRTLKIVRTAAH